MAHSHDDSAFVGKTEPFDDTTVIFGEDLNTDDALFQADWGLPEQTPFEGLYSTPLSWDPPAPPIPTVEKQSKLDQPQPPTLNAFNVMSSLTPAQREKLRSIAMPEHLTYPNESSPESLSTGKSASSPEQDNRRKRKSSAEDDEDDDDDEGNSAHPPVKKTAHNMIEKRYRTNLNDKIAALRDSVPSLRVTAKSARGEDVSGDKEDLQGLTPAHKLNKATVLSKATEYIRHLEKRNNRLHEENNSMKQRIAAFEKLFLSGSMGINPATPPTPYQYTQENFTSPSPGGRAAMDPQGMIQVPEDMRMLHAAQANQPIYHIPQEYPPQQRQVAPQGWNNGGYFGKLVVGSLAGLLIMEGFSEQEQEGDTPNARGLAAVPTQLLASLARSIHNMGDVRVLGYHIHIQNSFSWLKFFLMFGALIYVFVPSLFRSENKPKSEKEQTASISVAPSLASPIQVRRQAWLTAIQTVWVPRHNFFLEATALALKTMKLSLRNAIGWYGYSLLTGITEQEEAARVKSWEIALDAQLTGGDVDINKSRLVLTLMASGTLPDTPARLMLKALHIRILLWEFANSKFTGFTVFQVLAVKLARRKWNEARELHQMLSNSGDSNDALPEHLAALLEQTCDEVISDSVSQRAYNLAWNLPTNDKAIVSCDGMDAIIEDPSIRSPLDAVASWYSSLVLQRALASSLKQADATDIEKDLELAIKVSPIGSTAQTRALVARAVLLDEKRGANIAKVMQALGPANTPDTSITKLFESTPSISSLPDIQMSVHCAMALAHIKRAGSDSAAIQALVNKIGQPAATDLTLLGFASAYKLMQTLNMLDSAAIVYARPLEALACSLRLWIGGPRGAKSGLDKETRRPIIEHCLDIAKEVVGMKDAGYESMTDLDDDLGGC